jgi:hypothetical protein
MRPGSIFRTNLKGCTSLPGPGIAGAALPVTGHASASGRLHVRTWQSISGSIARAFVASSLAAHAPMRVESCLLQKLAHPWGEATGTVLSALGCSLSRSGVPGRSLTVIGAPAQAGRSRCRSVIHVGHMAEARPGHSGWHGHRRAKAQSGQSGPSPLRHYELVRLLSNTRSQQLPILVSSWHPATI